MRCRPPRLFVAADAEPPAVAFTAAGPGAGGEVLLQGNLNLGLLVLGTYESGGDGVPGRFSRRFFARRERPPAPPSCGVAGGGFAGPAPEAVDLGAMLGRWRNAEPRPTAVAGIHLEQAGDDLRLRADGIDGAFASARPAVYACLDEAGQPSLCLLARCDFGRRRSELQLRVTGGVLVSAGFHAAGDRRRPFFVREFYHR
ncbi:MAG: hypothetical protein D6696_14070 [Acidobacteria bacterium]|nr:MAG: hypothetical protein D6696_14070 [Acidobacteriota bacterium]